jgi:guanylate kinase
LKSSNPHLLIILTAPSGAGKTTIAHALLKAIPELGFTISATTRPPRPEEKNGKDYYFLDVNDFEQRISENAFIEYEMVYPGKYYGTLFSELERIWNEGKYPLRVVDVIGAAALKEKFGDHALSVFIQPPSIETLYERLKLRGTEDARSLEERLERVHREMNFAARFDYIVINNNLEQAVRQAIELIQIFIANKGL